VSAVSAEFASPLGKVLLSLGLVDETTLTQAAQLVRSSGGTLQGADLGQALLSMGVLSEEILFQAYSQLTGLPLWDGQGEVGAFESELDSQFLVYNRVLPVSHPDGPWLVIDDPLDDGLVDLLGRLASQATIGLHPPGEISDLLERHFSTPEANDSDSNSSQRSGIDIEHLKDLALEAPIIRQVNDLIGQAVRMGASDIHLEPSRSRVEVRFRVDGVLLARPSLDTDEYPAITSRVKILANLDIAERRQPQDGRIRTRSAGREVDIRVSVIPSLHGEDIVLRLLDQQRQVLGLNDCGISEPLVDKLRTSLSSAHGIVLVTGPTGSGKTTTLYSALTELENGSRKIVTIEDPVEYEMSGVVQIPVNNSVDMGFANILRAILRHDPDIIFVGEIRDRETAEIAIQAALTGHLVLATLHTNTAIGAVSRLIEMGIPDFLLSTSLLAVSAQRLVRRLCPECKTHTLASPALRERYGFPDGMLMYEPLGCSKCAQIGYRGRIPLFEYKAVDSQVRAEILSNPSIDALEAAAAQSNPQNLLDDGIAKVSAGQTSLEEVLRVVA
jgi:general secretion pathway protein E